jgi:hypothetical protein
LQPVTHDYRHVEDDMRKLHPHQPIAGLSGLTLEDFWIWAFSDLLTNTTRNGLAEFMVGFALGCLQSPRPGQDGGFFIYRNRRVEVRAAAYTQSQPQTRKSKINFDVAMRPTPAAPTGRLRPSDCYVFCLFTYEDFADKNAACMALIDTDYWDFYILPTRQINDMLGNQKTVGVTWLKQHTPGGPVAFDELKRRIDDVLGFKE